MAKVDNCRAYPRFSQDDYERIKYWAAKEDISVSEFVRDATLEKIAHINGDWDIPRFEQQRLNQLVDNIAGLIRVNQLLVDEVSDGFNGLLSLTRGDNYLLDEPDEY